MTTEATKSLSDLRTEDDGLYIWQPGNGTRYCLALTKIGSGTLITWLKYDDVGGPSFLILDIFEANMSIEYFMQKMAMKNEVDARAILDFLVRVEAIKEYYG